GRYPWLQRDEIGRGFQRGRAERNAAHSEERGLPRAGKRSRVPHGIAEIAAEIDARQNDVEVLPAIDPDGHAIGWRAVDAIRVTERHRRMRIAERSLCRDGVRGGRHFDMRSDDAHLTETRR